MILLNQNAIGGAGGYSYGGVAAGVGGAATSAQIVTGQQRRRLTLYGRNWPPPMAAPVAMATTASRGPMAGPVAPRSRRAHCLVPVT